MQKDIRHIKESYKGHDGLELFYQAWIPPSPRASIVILHGIGDHSSRYDHVGRHFCRLGYSVITYDQRGNGRSPGIRGHVRSFSEYLLDLKTLLETLHIKEKLFVLGHSFGGLVAIRFAMDYPAYLSGIIASSPAIGLSLKVPIWKKTLAYLFDRIYPEFTFVDNAVPTAYLSHDQKICDLCDNDPLVHRLRSARFFVEFVKIYTKTSAEPDRLSTPCLFLQAGDDKIVSSSATEKFFGAICGRDKTLKIYPDFYHEILNEVGKERVFDDMAAWLAKFND